jgi:SpoVK/Ycf46/Vps4 family AAA+-type ATPase
MTDGCAGSDLKEICRLAAMALVRELVGRSEKVHDERLYDKRVRDERHPAATAAAAANGRSMRKLTQADLETAVRSFAQSRLQLQL